MSKHPHPQNGQSITIRLSDAESASNDGRSYFFKLQLKAHDVVILHPSLGCPLIAKPDADLRIFLLADKDFQQLFDTDVDTRPLPDTDPPLPNPNGLYYKQGGPQVKAVINRVLKILKWDAGKEIEDVTLYPDTATALANIEVYSLGDSNGFIDGRLKDKDGKLFALLRDSARKAYQDLRAQYLFQVDLKVGAMSKPPKAEGLYDIAWLLPDPKLRTLASYAEIQDRATQAFIQKHCQNHRAQGDLPGVPQAYNITDAGFDFSTDPDTPIQNRHPILITSKDKLNLGHLTDVHVSSRQFAFRQSRAQVLQNADPGSGSKPIGELVNVAYESLKNLLDQHRASDIDVLVITGDLVDHHLNFDPTAVDKKNWAELMQSPGTAWEYLHNAHFKNPAIYPNYIDDLIFNSLLFDFYKSGKPVFLLHGNHELYTTPFGISPRILGIGAARANEGIPADHNLTIYEALLMYGPDYAWTRLMTHKRLSATNLEYYYTALTPFTDYAVTYGSQSFLGLSWGNSEDILTNFGGGMLPRAPESVSDAQWELVQSAIQKNPANEHALFTHFTFASYAINIPLDTTGEIGCDDASPGYTHFEEGSFKKKRYAMYQLLAEQKFNVTLSGHSHRFGLYEPVKFSESVNQEMYQTSATLKVKGHLPEKGGMTPGFSGCRILTGACGGPIAVQNHYDPGQVGLRQCGLAPPSGIKITLRGEERIEVIYATNSHAQPRFAVALDYFDLLQVESPADKNSKAKREVRPVFAEFRSVTDDGAFRIVINRNLPDVPFVKAMQLVAHITDDFGQGQWRQYPLNPKADGSRRMITQHDSAMQIEIEEKIINAEPTPSTFLSVSFNTALNGITGYKQYNYDSPWIYRVQIDKNMRDVDYGDDMRQEPVGGYTIARHGKHGEIPDFKWYKKNFKELYGAYERELPKSATKDK